MSDVPTTDSHYIAGLQYEIKQLQSELASVKEELERDVDIANLALNTLQNNPWPTSSPIWKHVEMWAEQKIRLSNKYRKEE